MYFFEHKFAVEIDEKGHTDRDQNGEHERQKKQKNILTAYFFTGIILMQKALIFFLEISKIQNYITQSNKEKLKKEKGVEIEKN